MIFAELTHWFGGDFDERKATAAAKAIWAAWRRLTTAPRE